MFKDITPVLQDPAAFRQVIEAFESLLEALKPEVIVGVESRGFIFGAPLAVKMGLPFVPVRKLGKLPSLTLREDYDLEYGTNTVEIHADAIVPGARVAIMDDLLATGGTAAATARLINRVGAEAICLGVVIELDFLNGRSMLSGLNVLSLIHVA
ncbi:MAG: adenine phosphoribosyltransferase [Armatimonadota bacterium]|nr:adenine phosphoribosyltransferase [Armatimonadota bacterium]